MPARVPGHPGLKGGAAPLLLPEPEASQSGSGTKSASIDGSNPFSASYGDPLDGASRQQGAAGDDHAASDTAGKGLEMHHAEGYMPLDKNVLRCSEFILPLEPAVIELYRRALQKAKEK